MSVMNLPLDALFFALLAALAFAALDLAQKWSARYAVATPAAFLALRLTAAAILSPLLLLIPGALTGRHIIEEPLAGLIAINLLANALYLISVYRADISTIGSLWPLKNAYLPLLLFVLPPHVVFPWKAYALILAATFGAVLIAWNDRLQLRAFKEKPVLLMIFVTIPLFALSDYFLNEAVKTMGSPLATVITALALFVLGVPMVIAHEPSRKIIRESIQNGRGIIGAGLTGLFLVIGVVFIGEAFKRGSVNPAGLALVNVYAMLSGVILLIVNALRSGWLEQQSRGVYALRFTGAILLIAAAAGLRQIEMNLK
jgi:energy-converting hydrogenase Eha subunit A